MDYCDLFIFDTILSKEFLGLLRYDDSSFWVALVFGVFVIFINSTIFCKDVYFRKIYFWMHIFFYLAFVIAVTFLVAKQASNSYNLVLLNQVGDGGNIKSYWLILCCSFLAIVSALHHPPRFRNTGILLPTISWRGVHANFITGLVLRSALIFGVLLMLAIITLDLALIHESQKTGYWKPNKVDFATRFALSFSLLPVLAFYSATRSIRVLLRMLTGDLKGYRPTALNRLAKRSQFNTSRKSLELRR